MSPNSHTKSDSNQACFDEKAFFLFQSNERSTAPQYWKRPVVFEDFILQFLKVAVRIHSPLKTKYSITFG